MTDVDIRGPELIESSLNEFWSTRKELYAEYMWLLGRRISQITRGDLNQDEYIKTWYKKLLE